MKRMRHDRRSRRWWAAATSAAVAVGVAGATVPAVTSAADVDAATTRPAQPAPSADRRDGGRGRPYRQGGGFGFGRRSAGPQASDVDPAEVAAFMSEHAPLYWKAVTNLADDGRREQTQALIATAYATYQRLKPDDPELYDVIVKRIESEDHIFGLRPKARAAAAGPIREAAVAQLRAELTTWCDLTLKERHLRLARLQRKVDDEKSRLASDDANRQAIIDQRLDRILNGNGGGPFPGGPPFHGDREPSHDSSR